KPGRTVPEMMTSMRPRQRLSAPTPAYPPLHQFSACNFRRAGAVKGAMLSPPSVSFRAHYQALVSSGALEPDAAQEKAVEAFAALEQRLSSYKPARKQGLLGRLFTDKNGGPPCGLYVYGEV